MGKSYSAEYREEAMKLVKEIGKKQAVKNWTLQVNNESIIKIIQFRADNPFQVYVHRGGEFSCTTLIAV